MSQNRKIVSATVTFDAALRNEEGEPLSVAVEVEVAQRASFETVQAALINQAFQNLGASASLSCIETKAYGRDRTVAEAAKVVQLTDYDESSHSAVAHMSDGSTSTFHFDDDHTVHCDEEGNVVSYGAE